ncbi:hypothetical protein SODALDRAFT_327223 [Sodiomyces alkalinus F11]|uniref:Uncharacterized protein n=1 Tax=Sodiomyces alkalinus (strain CBS 110278 / VKM F-3762 / F11) TaxID=1314773 RepID=A0A3N2Q8N7_SODAK|nr:hypothetical protein SODALDRAFT_327223 [Sodiomyces alkalinus F11]ROT43057.1 hypothetical protein SODALDRAFT_327223 [Sodiomyces alkalinus F11]
MASEITSSIRTDHLFWAQYGATSVVPSSIGQSCLALATITPLLAYPFLPHRNRVSGDYNPAGCLVTISRCQLLFHLILTLFSVRDVANKSIATPIPTNTWPLFLSIFIHSASYPATSFSANNRLRPSDFNLAGHWACYSLLYFLFRAFDTIIGLSPSYAFVIAALIIFPISERLTKYVTKHTHTYITRNISSLSWLWPTRGADDFDPGWSVILFIALLIEQAILIPIALADALRNR